MRPIIADNRAVKGDLLVIQIYCPDKLPSFQEFVNDLNLDNTIRAEPMELRDRVAGLMEQARADLAELVAIPSVADPRQYPPEECARAATWVLDAFAAVGFGDARLAETADGSGVVGSRPCGDPPRRRSCCTPTTTSSRR